MTAKKAPPEHQIAEAAFHLWNNEGRPEGMADVHWHRAKTMLEAGESGAHAPKPAAARPKAAGKAAPKRASKAAAEPAAGSVSAGAAKKPRAARKPKTLPGDPG